MGRTFPTVSWAARRVRSINRQIARHTLLSDIDELAGVHALDGNEGRGALLEAQGVAEDNLGKGSTTAGVVDDCETISMRMACRHDTYSP